MAEDYRDFPASERPDVEVLVDDVWYAGELRAWLRRDGTWWANVTYRRGPALQHVATVASDRVRQAEPPGEHLGQK